MKDLTLLIPANKEAESLPIFLNELNIKTIERQINNSLIGKFFSSIRLK